VEIAIVILILVFLLLIAGAVFVAAPAVAGRFVARVLTSPSTNPARRLVSVVVAVVVPMALTALAALALSYSTDPVVRVDGVETNCSSWIMDDPLPPRVAEQCDFQSGDRSRQALLAASGAAVATGFTIAFVLVFVRRSGALAAPPRASALASGSGER